MATQPPEEIPFTLSSFPGANPQESAGRLINTYSEPLGDPSQSGYGAPKNAMVWRRMPGLTQFAQTGQSGYRGGLLAGATDYEVFGGEVITLDVNGNVTPLGALPGTLPVSIARNQNETSPDVVAVDPVNGAYVLNSAILPATTTVALTGGPAGGGGVLSIIFTNPTLTLNGASFPVTVSHTLVAGQTITTAAAALVTAINANVTLSAAAISATSSAGVITINQLGIIGNSTVITRANTSAAITMSLPTGGIMSGGAGVAGTFTGTPTFYNGQTNLPQPNSVSFQDGYFFFTVASGSVYASGLNSLTQNALTFGRIEAKSDVTLLRGIAYQGYMFFFTTGSCEIWQDQANPAPAFPYGRMAILAYGLLQGSAIAGYETGFDDLLWVSQDFGVYHMPQGSLQPAKVSPPDLDRLIEAQARAGNTIVASAYIFAGKKAWVLTSPAWTWQFHLNSQKWFERQSLQANGEHGQWRGIGGHPAFGKWLMGDTQSGAIVYIDDTNGYDIVVQDPVSWVTSFIQMLMRIDSGVVDRFPARTRVARADFRFVRGVGIQVNALTATVTGAVVSPTSPPLIRLQLVTLGINTGDQIQVMGVTGTTEANGTWFVTIIDGKNLELQGSNFANTYVSGGTVTDFTVLPTFTDPTVAVSWSDDGGITYRPPVLRHLGPQEVIKTGRVSVKNTGLTGVIGRRWRLDITAPLQVAFIRGTQSSDPSIIN